MHFLIKRWLLALVLTVAVVCCRKSTNMTDDISKTVPTMEFDHGFAAAAFAPGRYATAIQRTMHGTHALQVLNEDSTSSFVLNLAADGTATACRGWRYLFRNNGPQVNTEDGYREQQGYSGRYAVVNGVAELTLKLDNTVCPHVFEGALALVRTPNIEMQCVLATPSGHGELSAPVLLCRSADGKPVELEPYIVEKFAPAGWFALGSGSGLRVWLTGRPPGAQAGDATEAKVKLASELVGENAWEQAF